MLHRLKDLIIFLAGAVAAGAAGALPQKLVEDGAYQPFREKLQELADYVDQTVLKWDIPSVVASGGLEPELILIPAGPFLMGSDKRRDPAASDRELPQHEVYLDDFYIAKHPITDAQCRRFVEMTGRCSPRRDGYDVRKAEHPVTHVAWDDARAYCRWLSGETGKSYRLPSEAEWEKAARGTNGRIYPWGDDSPDENRCNFDMKVGGTTPIGRYSPRGDSPYGCTDMAGNVWEWTRSLWGKDWEIPDFRYPYGPKDGREDLDAGDDVLRVLRGGSFGFGEGGVLCACRFEDVPNSHSVNLTALGFRVVVAPI